MKNIHIVLIALYSFLGVVLMVLNWDLFTVNLEINLGFMVVYFPFVSVLFFSGLLLLVIQWGLMRLQEVSLVRSVREKENEVEKLKSNILDEQTPHIADVMANMGYIDEKVDRIMKALKIEQIDEEQTQSE